MDGNCLITVNTEKKNAVELKNMGLVEQHSYAVLDLVKVEVIKLSIWPTFFNKQIHILTI